MCSGKNHHEGGLKRREFLQTVGAGATLATLLPRPYWGQAALAAEPIPKIEKRKARLRAAFLYPPTSQLENEGYYSWPGSTFGAEQRHKEYTQTFKTLETQLGLSIDCAAEPIYTPEQIQRFVKMIQEEKPDGVLLTVFKKTLWQSHGLEILDQIGLPTVVLAPLGVLLVGSVHQLEDRKGVLMICSEDPSQDLVTPLSMIRTSVQMAQSVIVNIQGNERKDTRVPGIGTTVHTIPQQVYIDIFNQTGEQDEVRTLAREYQSRAVEIVEPKEVDITDAARSYFALRKIIETEQADALMMDCLPGLKIPHRHVPPCMGFMSLRDEGIPAGCESDLDATLSLMLLQSLFGKPGFQHNPGVDTEDNHYFCAHCTSASRMRGIDQPPEPLALRSHAEAGWGCVPRVLFSQGQEITITKYLSGEAPQLLLYSGKILQCPPIPPTGGCRTNAVTTINELKDVSALKGHHLCMVYGDYTKELGRYCQLYGIQVET